jgi:hypothetical protein
MKLIERCSGQGVDSAQFKIINISTEVIMPYYVYKITNKYNNKFYIGKRKHNNPEMDSYMGSGKLIRSAVEKYGKDSFVKEIIDVFDTNNEAALLEKSLVTKDVVDSGQSYNMHEGGHGGFAHINKLPPCERVNIKSLLSKIASGSISVGGTSNWTSESWKKVRYTGWDERKKRGEYFNTNSWINLTEEERKARIAKLSAKSKGELNSQYGKIWCVKENDVDLKNRKPFITIPEGWISIKEWKDRKKNKNNNAYGRRWFNNGQQNFFLYPEDITTQTLVLGRLWKKESAE